MTDEDTGSTSQTKLEAPVTETGKWSGVSHGSLDVLLESKSFVHVYLQACVDFPGLLWLHPSCLASFSILLQTSCTSIDPSLTRMFWAPEETKQRPEWVFECGAL